MRTSFVSTAVAASVLIFALTGCGQTADVPASATDDSSQTDDTGTDDAGTDAGTDDTGALPQPTLASEADGSGLTMGMANDGITPSTLEISVGDTVTFESADDGFHGLLVNGLASVTVATNLPIFYTFTEPGTYAVSDELSDATATITVK